MKHLAFRVLVLFIVLWPLTQYLAEYHVDPHKPAWQEDPLFNTMLGVAFYIGIQGLWEAYNILNRQRIQLERLRQ